MAVRNAGTTPIDEANAEELIQSAVDAIGPDVPNDYRIKTAALSS